MSRSMLENGERGTPGQPKFKPKTIYLDFYSMLFSIQTIILTILTRYLSVLYSMII